MAPCCNNIVTPKMIRAGRVSVGDRIQFEDDYISARSDELSVSERNEPQPSDSAVSVQAETTTPASAASSKEAPAAVMAAGPAAGSASAAAPANNSSTVGQVRTRLLQMPKGGLPLLYAPSFSPFLTQR